MTQKFTIITQCLGRRPLSSLCANVAEAPSTSPEEAVDEKDSERPVSMDPFKALKYAETTAARIAQLLAPRRTRRPGD